MVAKPFRVLYWRTDKLAACKKCGGTGFYWASTTHGWRLFTSELTESDRTNHTQVCKGTLSYVPDAPAFVPVSSSADLAPILAELSRLAGEDYRIMDRADTAHGIARVAATEVERLGSLIHDLDKARPITVTVNGRDAVDVGRQHETYETVLRMTVAGLNVQMVGPAGSGKSRAGRSIATALGLPFYAVPLGPQTSKSDLLGFTNGAGQYVRTLLRDAFERGGVILLDEIDAANPAVLTIINDMLANDEAGFADGMVNRHADCHFLSAANTYGLGADRIYVGRAQLDAATLDRWVKVPWDYDWSFTRLLAGNDAFTSRVQALSEEAAKLAMRVVIGPRAAIHGAKLLAAGFTPEQAEAATIWSGMSKDDAAKLRANAATRGL